MHFTMNFCVSSLNLIQHNLKVMPCRRYEIGLMKIEVHAHAHHVRRTGNLKMNWKWPKKTNLIDYYVSDYKDLSIAECGLRKKKINRKVLIRKAAAFSWKWYVFFSLEIGRSWRCVRSIEPVVHAFKSSFYCCF